MIIARIASLWILEIVAAVSSILYTTYIDERDTRVFFMQILLLVLVILTCYLLQYSLRSIRMMRQSDYKQIYEDAGRAAVQALRQMIEERQNAPNE